MKNTRARYIVCPILLILSGLSFSKSQSVNPADVELAQRTEEKRNSPEPYDPSVEAILGDIGLPTKAPPSDWEMEQQSQRELKQFLYGFDQRPLEIESDAHQTKSRIYLAGSIVLGLTALCFLVFGHEHKNRGRGQVC